MRTVWRFHGAGELVFGWGAVNEAGELSSRMGLKRIFLLTDKTLLKFEIAQKVITPLLNAGIIVEVFDGGEPEPTLPAVLKAIEAAKAFGPDGVCGVGGGSNMDMAKIVACLLYTSPSPRD